MERTELTERQREFFDRLDALFVEFNASLYGDGEDPGGYQEASDVPHMFKFKVDGEVFEEVRINDPDDWGHPPRKVYTIVQKPDCFDLVLHQREQAS